MAWKLVGDGLSQGVARPLKDVTYGGAVTAGKLIVRAGDDGKYDEVGDDGTRLSGQAVGTGVLATEGEMLPIDNFQLWENTYTGTYNVNMLGARVALNASQVIDLADLGTATKNIFQVDSVNTTDVTARGHFIVGACEAIGAEV